VGRGEGRKEWGRKGEYASLALGGMDATVAITVRVGRRVVVFGDGRCLFRSVAKLLYRSLRTADRGPSGELTSLEFAQEEQLKVDLLRAEICNVLSEHKDLLREMSGNLPFVLDNSQTNDNLQVGKTEIAHVIFANVYAGPDAEFQLNTLS